MVVVGCQGSCSIQYWFQPKLSGFWSPCKRLSVPQEDWELSVLQEDWELPDTRLRVSVWGSQSCRNL